MENEQAGAGRGRPNPSRETKLLGTNGNREMFIFPVQLATRRVGNLARLIHTLLYVMAMHIYIMYYMYIKYKRARCLRVVHVRSAGKRDGFYLY